jgi:hypothetical protein
LNVALAPESDAHRKLRPPRPNGSQQPASPNLASGFKPQPGWNLTDTGGRTMSSLTFVNCFVGSGNAWSPDDRTRIDDALHGALTDSALQSVIAQYYPGTISSTMLPSLVHESEIPATVYKDTVENLVAELHNGGALGAADPAESIIDIMLPRGIVLSSEPSMPGHAASGESDSEGGADGHGVELDPKDALTSTEGLGGYHGSIHPSPGTTVYYAVGVYSEGHNGIAAFDESWKNVVATFYHELNEARTDSDVEDVNTTNNSGLLGWYSNTGEGEIGDLPINECGGDLSLVFKEVPLANSRETVPIQLMWSNAADGPAASA